MLVLSRQKDESVVIGDNIEVIIIDVRGDKVRLGFIYPKGVSIHRREIYDAIQREKQRDSADTESAGTELVEKNKRTYFHCCGAYGSNLAKQNAYTLESSQSGKRLDCISLDISGYCHLGPNNLSNKCPFGIEKLVEPPL